MDIDFKKVADEMLSAIKGIVKQHFDEAKDIAHGEFEGYARRTVELSELVASGKLDVDQATAILKIRKNSIETVLLSIAGIGILAAQQSINVAIKTLKDVLAQLIPGLSVLG